MAVALKAFYDGSGTHFGRNGQRIVALAGHAATLDVWDAFERDWWAVLADSSSRPVCASLHMADAQTLRGDFAPEKGWSNDRVHALLRDLFNRCFSPRGLHVDVEQSLVGASCWVDRDAYDEVCREFPHFREKPPEALCVDHVVGIAISCLIPGEGRVAYTDMIDRRRSIALYFDRGERFKGHIERVWASRKWRRRSRPLKLIHSIDTVDRRESAAIQAADYLAWHVNRHVNAEPGDLWARTTAVFSARLYELAYDYDELRRTAKRWTPEGGYRRE